MDNEFQHTYGPDGWMIHKEKLSSSKTTPSELLDYVSNPKYGMRIKETATYHVNATPDVLQKAFDSGEPKLESAAALHPKASTDLLLKAIHSSNSMAARNAVLNPKLPAEHLDTALNHFQASVRRSVIRHPQHTEDHLFKMLDDPDPIVADSALDSSKSTPKLFDAALEHSHPAIKIKAIMHHPKLSDDQKQELRNDPDRRVRAAVLDRWL